MRLVKGRQRNEPGQRRDDIGIYPYRARVDGSAMHHAMAGPDQLMLRKVALQPAKDRFERIFVRASFRQAPVEKLRATPVSRRKADAMVNAFARTVAKEAFAGRLPVAGKERKLDAR